LSACLWILALFLGQNALVYLFPEKAPSLVLIGVLYYALAEGAFSGFVCGVWGGLLLDLLSQGRPGFFTAALAAAGGLCGYVSSKIFEDSWLAEIVLPFLGLYALAFSQHIFLKTQTGEAVLPGVFTEAFLPWPLLTTALVSPWLFARLRRVSPRRRAARGR
jgi:rod shape-determining protein MreD